jgi:hypothetical protein
VGVVAPLYVVANTQFSFNPAKNVEIRLFCIILDQKPIKIEHETTNLNMFNFDGVLRFVI